MTLLLRPTVPFLPPSVDPSAAALLFPYLNPFLQSHLNFGHILPAGNAAAADKEESSVPTPIARPSSPLDHTQVSPGSGSVGGDDRASSVGSASSCESWTVDDVCKFVGGVETCEEYEQVSKDYYFSFPCA